MDHKKCLQRGCLKIECKRLDRWCFESASRKSDALKAQLEHLPQEEGWLPAGIRLGLAALDDCFLVLNLDILADWFGGWQQRRVPAMISFKCSEKHQSCHWASESECKVCHSHFALVVDESQAAIVPFKRAPKGLQDLECWDNL